MSSDSKVDLPDHVDVAVVGQHSLDQASVAPASVRSQTWRRPRQPGVSMCASAPGKVNPSCPSDHRTR